MTTPEYAPPIIDEGLTFIEAGIDELNRVLPGWTEEHDGQVDPHLRLLAQVRGLRLRLAAAEASLEAAAARIMPKRVELPGLVAERKGGANRKNWDHERLAGRVVMSIGADPGTGELIAERYDVAKAATDALFAVAHVDYWRTGALKERGIVFDDCVETERGRRTVHLVEAAFEPDDDKVNPDTPIDLVPVA